MLSPSEPSTASATRATWPAPPYRGAARSRSATSACRPSSRGVDDRAPDRGRAYRDHPPHQARRQASTSASSPTSPFTQEAGRDPHGQGQGRAGGAGWPWSSPGRMIFEIEGVDRGARLRGVPPRAPQAADPDPVRDPRGRLMQAEGSPRHSSDRAELTREPGAARTRADDPLPACAAAAPNQTPRARAARTAPRHRAGAAPSAQRARGTGARAQVTDDACETVATADKRRSTGVVVIATSMDKTDRGASFEARPRRTRCTGKYVKHRVEVSTLHDERNALQRRRSRRDHRDPSAVARQALAARACAMLRRRASGLSHDSDRNRPRRRRQHRRAQACSASRCSAARGRRYASLGDIIVVLGEGGHVPTPR